MYIIGVSDGPFQTHIISHKASSSINRDIFSVTSSPIEDYPMIYARTDNEELAHRIRDTINTWIKERN